MYVRGVYLIYTTQGVKRREPRGHGLYILFLFTDDCLMSSAVQYMYTCRQEKYRT